MIALNDVYAPTETIIQLEYEEKNAQIHVRDIPSGRISLFLDIVRKRLNRDPFTFAGQLFVPVDEEAELLQLPESCARGRRMLNEAVADATPNLENQRKLLYFMRSFGSFPISSYDPDHPVARAHTIYENVMNALYDENFAKEKRLLEGQLQELKQKFICPMRW